MIEGVTRNHERLWPFLENIAERSNGQMTAADLMSEIKQGWKQAYQINGFQAVAVTSAHEGHIFVHGCVGEGAEDWRDELDDFLRAWAKATNRTRIIGLVRPGWWRWAKNKGYQETHRELVLEV